MSAKNRAGQVTLIAGSDGWAMPMRLLEGESWPPERPRDQRAVAQHRAGVDNRNISCVLSNSSGLSDRHIGDDSKKGNCGRQGT